MTLSRAQKFSKRFASEEKFEAMKQESLLWGFTCKNCSTWSSIWEIGGIRYKAKGNPRMRIKCPECGVKAMQKITKKEENQE